MKFLEELENVLKQNKNFIAEDRSVLKAKIYDACMNMDEELLSLLLDHDHMKTHFFTYVDGKYVFDKVKFAWVIESKEFLPDSYTLFKNKVGLSDNQGDLISKKNDVTLVWPYKDCVLEGGQTKEDQKRNEKFYNEVLAPDEINKLFSSKVFTNAEKYNAKGKHRTTDFDEGDNLVIKGNNLLSLYSILKRYEGKIKCIYIDPPYNTQSDTFGYNDKFSRSTWLTFMKNRLEVAKRLLAEDGAIYVQLDYNQVHYAKVLMDEVFGEENFQREIIWRIGWVSGYKTAVKNYIRNHDTILFYSKNSSELNFIKKYIDNSEFTPRVKNTKKFINRLISAGIEKEEAEEIAYEINYSTRPERYPIEDVWNGNEYDDLHSIAIVSFSGETVSKMLGTDEIKGQKSEKLIKRIIEAHTVEGDIVLDFFGGSGTTAAVAHKMNRKYILCEQLEEHIDTTLMRLQKVIDGEQSGISKSVNWSGGGSFVYCELKKLNQDYIDAIESANSGREVEITLKNAIQRGHIKPFVEIEELISSIDEFRELNLDEKKKFVLEILDKNKLYVNSCDIDDEDMGVTREEKAFTNSFYNNYQKSGE